MRSRRSPPASFARVKIARSPSIVQTSSSPAAKRSEVRAGDGIVVCALLVGLLVIIIASMVDIR